MLAINIFLASPISSPPRDLDKTSRSCAATHPVKIAWLASVRQYHLHKLGKALKIESEIIESNLFNEEDEGWSELTRHDACKRVLWEADEALGMPAILDRLREAGYQTHLKRQKLSNACYTALDRKKDMFTKKGQKWGLAEWDDSFWES